MASRRLPRHIGVIPDGNRRWALDQGLPVQNGYAAGIAPGVALFELCETMGIEEISVYGFTKDNTKRPFIQVEAYRAACVEMVGEIFRRGAAVLVMGDETSKLFPEELKVFRHRQGKGTKVNFLINYGWQWDLAGLKMGALRSAAVSRLDLIVRWGGGRRLSGFLPAQSAYADIFVVDDYWPDYRPCQFEQALAWYRQQDRTFGG